MAKRKVMSAVPWLIAVIAGLGCFQGIGHAVQATPSRSTTGTPSQLQWWKGLATNSWSPQHAVVSFVGKDALDCGQFGPDISEVQLAGAIVCAQTAARDHKSFSTIRHFLGPMEDVGSGSFESQRWLAEGLFGTGDGIMRRFDYKGFFINVMYKTIGSPPQPIVKESVCSAPHAVRDPSGAVVLACGA